MIRTGDTRLVYQTGLTLEELNLLVVTTVKDRRLVVTQNTTISLQDSDLLTANSLPSTTFSNLPLYGTKLLEALDRTDHLLGKLYYGIDDDGSRYLAGVEGVANHIDQIIDGLNQGRADVLIPLLDHMSDFDCNPVLEMKSVQGRSMGGQLWFEAAPLQVTFLPGIAKLVLMSIVRHKLPPELAGFSENLQEVCRDYHAAATTLGSNPSVFYEKFPDVRNVVDASVVVGLALSYPPGQLQVHGPRTVAAPPMRAHRMHEHPDLLLQACRAGELSTDGKALLVQALHKLAEPAFGQVISFDYERSLPLIVCAGGERETEFVVRAALKRYTMQNKSDDNILALEQIVQNARKAGDQQQQWIWRYRLADVEARNGHVRQALSHLRHLRKTGPTSEAKQQAKQAIELLER